MWVRYLTIAAVSDGSRRYGWWLRTWDRGTPQSPPKQCNACVWLVPGTQFED